MCTHCGCLRYRLRAVNQKVKRTLSIAEKCQELVALILTISTVELKFT